VPRDEAFQAINQESDAIATRITPFGAQAGLIRSKQLRDEADCRQGHKPCEDRVNVVFWGTVLSVE
jgi:hypothetical protein